MQTLHFSIYILIFLVALALIFDFVSGFQNATNSIATVVSTGILKPYPAVVMAAVFNTAAYFVFDLHVAKTIGKGIVSEMVSAYTVGWLVGNIAQGGIKGGIYNMQRSGIMMLY